MVFLEERYPKNDVAYAHVGIHIHVLYRTELRAALTGITGYVYIVLGVRAMVLDPLWCSSCCRQVWHKFSEISRLSPMGDFC